MTLRIALTSLVLLCVGCSDAGESPPVQPEGSQPPPARAAAASEPDAAGDRPGLAEWVRAARAGSLILRERATGELLQSPAIATEIEIAVTGTVARASVRQRFSNPSPSWVEALYVFPLPDDAAVDHMRIATDGRVIEGQIQEKEEARRTYETARAEGRRAGLVEQERPNVFTTSVANVAPGSEIEVEIEYQQSVHQDDGLFSLRVPTVVAARYLPGEAAREAGLPEPAGRVEIAVDLAPGFDLERLESPYHPIAVEDDGETYRVALADGPVPADRDFVLQWAPAPGDAPEAAVFTETWGSRTYALVMVTPPFGESAERRGLPREVVYVVDTSGSMHGASIVQAKAALAFALERLSAEDHFNVIAFASATTALFPESRPAHPAHVEEALDFVAGLEANGGTEIGPAIRLALEEAATSPTRLRQVVFLTDGAVGNERQLLEDLKARLRGVGGDGGDGGSRVFAIGIGPAPNTFFMRRLAQLGRGTFTHIGDPSEVAEKMTGLFRKLESAVLTDIALELPGGPEADAYPYRVPDLYAGEPVVVALALAAPLSGASVTGFRGDEPWRVDLDELVEERTGIHALWARRAIAEREDDRLGARDEALQAQLRGEIVEIATAHHLVSAFTSLVAVDVTPVRPDDASLEAHALGAALPSAWQADSDFGFAQGATPAALHLGIGLLAIAASLASRRILA